MNKKGALQLSIQAIVVVVIAMTLLGLGLMFVRSQFKDLGGLSKEVTAQTEEQILQQLRTGGEKLAVQSELVLGKRESDIIGIGIVNTQDSPLYYRIQVNYKKAKNVGEEGDINFFYDNETWYRLDTVQEVVRSIEATAGTTSDTYIYEVEIKQCIPQEEEYDDEKCFDWEQPFDKKSFFVKVQ